MAEGIVDERLLQRLAAQAGQGEGLAAEAGQLSKVLQLQPLPLHTRAPLPPPMQPMQPIQVAGRPPLLERALPDRYRDPTVDPDTGMTVEETQADRYRGLGERVFPTRYRDALSTLARRNKLLGQRLVPGGEPGAYPWEPDPHYYTRAIPQHLRWRLNVGQPPTRTQRSEGALYPAAGGDELYSAPPATGR